MLLEDKYRCQKCGVREYRIFLENDKMYLLQCQNCARGLDSIRRSLNLIVYKEVCN